jgi:DNA-binding beta-propeller fold protein YncE
MAKKWILIEIEKGSIMERMAPLGKEAIAVNPTTNKVYATNRSQGILYEIDG